MYNLVYLRDVSGNFPTGGSRLAYNMIAWQVPPGFQKLDKRVCVMPQIVPRKL